jgi:hypothetical protein
MTIGSNFEATSFSLDAGARLYDGKKTRSFFHPSPQGDELWRSP